MSQEINDRDTYRIAMARALVTGRGLGQVADIAVQAKEKGIKLDDRDAQAVKALLTPTPIPSAQG